MEIEFKLHLQPPTITQQEHKIGKSKSGRPYIYEPEELKDAREKLTAYLSQYKPPREMMGPVKMMVTWLFHNPKMTKGRFRWRTRKPDTDNLQKMLKDCMTRLDFWEDDAQVVYEVITKMDVGDPKDAGIYIKLEEMDDSEV